MWLLVLPIWSTSVLFGSFHWLIWERARAPPRPLLWEVFYFSHLIATAWCSCTGKWDSPIAPSNHHLKSKNIEMSLEEKGNVSPAYGGGGQQMNIIKTHFVRQESPPGLCPLVKLSPGQIFWVSFYAEHVPPLLLRLHQWCTLNNVIISLSYSPAD